MIGFILLIVFCAVCFLTGSAIGYSQGYLEAQRGQWQRKGERTSAQHGRLMDIKPSR